MANGEWLMEQTSENGERQVSSFFSNGAVVGFTRNASSSGERGSYVHSIKALTHGQVQKIPASGYWKLAEDIPQINLNSLSHLATIMNYMTRHATAVVGKMKAHERLCVLLGTIASRQHQLSDSKKVQLHMTRLDIADHLGLTSDTVSRAFKKLESDSVIDSSARYIELLQPEYIWRYAAEKYENCKPYEIL